MEYNNWNEKEIIHNKDKINFTELLKHRKLSENTLRQLIGYVNLHDVLITQNLTPDFIFNYVMNDRYHEEDNERTITLGLVLAHQNVLIEQLLALIHRNS